MHPKSICFFAHAGSQLLFAGDMNFLAARGFYKKCSGGPGLIGNGCFQDALILSSE